MPPGTTGPHGAGSVTSATANEPRTRAQAPRSLPVQWGLGSDVEPSTGMFRGGALCGSSLLERLLRRLLSKLLRFLRALHLHPSWALSLTAVVGVTRESREAKNPSSLTGGDGQGVRARRVSHGSPAHFPLGTAFVIAAAIAATPAISHPAMPCLACRQLGDNAHDLLSRTHETLTRPEGTHPRQGGDRGGTWSRARRFRICSRNGHERRRRR